MPVPRPSYPMLPQGYLESEARASGVPAELVPHIAQFIRRIMDKQAIDERLNYQWINDNMGGSGRGRYADQVVAAVDSLDNDKDGADYVCTGSSDEDTINAALDVLDNSLPGGRLRLCAGGYQCADSIIVPEGANIEGDGFSTFVHRSGAGTSPVFLMKPNWEFESRIANLGIDGNNVAEVGVYADAASALLDLDNLYIYWATDHCVFFDRTGGFDHNDFRIRNCIIATGGTGITIVEANHGWVVDNWIEGDYGIVLSGGAQGTLLRSNIIFGGEYGIVIDDASATKVADNWITGGSVEGISTTNVSEYNNIIGNTVENFPVGILMDALTANNFVTVNDLRNCTAAITDTGTTNIKIHNPGDDI